MYKLKEMIFYVYDIILKLWMSEELKTLTDISYFEIENVDKISVF